MMTKGNAILREPFASAILRSVLFCHPEGTERPKDLARVLRQKMRFFATAQNDRGEGQND